MSRVLQVTAPGNLKLIVNEIHDHTFDVEDVTFDAATACIRVPIEPNWVLEIAEVESYRLVESEGVGNYDVNQLLYSEADGSLVITTDVPLTFTVRVSGLDISLLELADG